MGKESLQIKQHIDEERTKLDMNIAKLERDFAVVKEVVTACWKNPLTLVGVGIVIALVVAEQMSSRNSVKPIQSTMTTLSDIAA